MRSLRIKFSRQTLIFTALCSGFLAAFIGSIPSNPARPHAGQLLANPLSEMPGSASPDGWNPSTSGASENSQPREGGSHTLDAESQAEPLEDLSGAEAETLSLSQSTNGETRPVAIPAINYLGEEDDCSAWISVQNVGDEPSQAVFLTWTRDRWSGQAELFLSCSGLIAPAGHWAMQSYWLGWQSPRSSLVYSFKAIPISKTGLRVDPALQNELIGNYFCEGLQEEFEESENADREFRMAYEAGRQYLGVPLEFVKGGATQSSCYAFMF